MSAGLVATPDATRDEAGEVLSMADTMIVNHHWR